MTDKQYRFVNEYLIDLNGAQAAIRAGYSPKTAQEQSSRLLSNVKVQQRIQKAQSERSKRTEITADAVLAEYAKIAFSNMEDFAVWDGDVVVLRNSQHMNRDKLSAVESVIETKDGVKIKLYNKLGALDALAKHLGLAAPVNVNVKGSLDIVNIFKELADLQSAGDEITDGDNTQKHSENTE